VDFVGFKRQRFCKDFGPGIYGVMAEGGDLI
jgi:hypothetical protein